MQGLPTAQDHAARGSRALHKSQYPGVGIEDSITPIAHGGPEPAAVPLEKKAGDTVTFEQLRAVTKAIDGFTRLNELLVLIKEVGDLRKMKELLEAMTVPKTDKISV